MPPDRIVLELALFFLGCVVGAALRCRWQAAQIVRAAKEHARALIAEAEESARAMLIEAQQRAAEIEGAAATRARRLVLTALQVALRIPPRGP